MAQMDDDTDVLVISQFYRPETIGSGPFCADLAEAIAMTGQRVKVVTARPHYPGNTVFPPYRDGTRDRQFINRVEIARIPIFARGRDSALCRLLSEGSLLLGAGATLARDSARSAPIIISLCPSIFAVMLGTVLRRRGARCVAIVHDIQSGMAEGLGIAGRFVVRALRRVERSVFNRCDLIIVLSEEMRARLRDAGVSCPVEVHPIWIDTDAIQPRPAWPGLARTALYSGNFGRKQGLLQLIDLAQELRGRGSPLRVRLRGRGSQEELIRQEVKNRGLQNVDIRDLIRPEGLADGLAEGDIHLVPQDPSIADYAVPSKIYGIMAAGRPFVATARRDSTLWRLREESGAFVCVPPNDAKSFASAVMKLAANPARRMELGQRGRDYVTQHCAKKTSLGRLMNTIAGTCRPDEAHPW
jgi:colanic acid biosynthesis glycosyl transferase WcaI